jgi:hypothetical protein
MLLPASIASDLALIVPEMYVKPRTAPAWLYFIKNKPEPDGTEYPEVAGEEVNVYMLNPAV